MIPDSRGLTPHHRHRTQSPCPRSTQQLQKKSLGLVVQMLSKDHVIGLETAEYLITGIPCNRLQVNPGSSFKFEFGGF